MVNGVAHTNEKSKSGQSSGSSAKQTKAGVDGATLSAVGTKAKRKLGTCLVSGGVEYYYQRSPHRFSCLP